MTNSDNQPEQSMEEIIASIRKMIAEEPKPDSTPDRSITEQKPSPLSELIPAGADLATFFDQSSSSAALSSVSETPSLQPETLPQASQPQTASPVAEVPFEPDTNFSKQPLYPADQGHLYPAPQDVPQDVQRHEQNSEDPDALPPLSPFSEHPAINPADGHEDESERLQDPEDGSDSQLRSVAENDDGQSNAAVFGAASMPEHSHHPVDQDLLDPVSQDMPQDIQRDEQHSESSDALHRLSPLPEHPFDNSADRHEDESECQQDFEDETAQQSSSVSENDDGQFIPPLSDATAMAAESGEPADHAALSEITKADAALSETLAIEPVFPADSNAQRSIQASLEDMTQSTETREQENQDDFSDIAKAGTARVDPQLTVSSSIADNDDEFCDQFTYGDMVVPAENRDQVEHHKAEAAEADAASPISEPVADRKSDEQAMPTPVSQPDDLEPEISDHTETIQSEQFADSLQQITEEPPQPIGFIKRSPEKSELQLSEYSGQPVAERLDDVAVGNEDACESMEKTWPAENEDHVSDARVDAEMPREKKQADAYDEPSMTVREESSAAAVKSADQPSGTGSPQPQIEAALSDLIRPIIHRWLEDNVPVIIDSAVKKSKTPKDDDETH